MDGRIDVTKIPFVCRNLPIRLHVPFPDKEHKLLLGEFGIYHCKRDAMESRVPSSKKWVFPSVRHQIQFKKLA